MRLRLSRASTTDPPLIRALELIDSKTDYDASEMTLQRSEVSAPALGTGIFGRSRLGAQAVRASPSAFHASARLSGKSDFFAKDTLAKDVSTRDNGSPVRVSSLTYPLTSGQLARSGSRSRDYAASKSNLRRGPVLRRSEFSRSRIGQSRGIGGGANQTAARILGTARSAVQSHG